MSTGFPVEIALKPQHLYSCVCDTVIQCDLNKVFRLYNQQNFWIPVLDTGMTGIGYGMKEVDIGIVAEMTYSNTKGVIYTYFKLFKFPLKIR